MGAFVAGILIGESPILTRHIDEQLRGLIAALFMPVFFGLSGLRADLTVLRHGDLALLTVAIILIASIGKFLGAFLGGKLGGLSRAESLALGCGMNARGSTEVIVATIGLSMGVLNQNLFTPIVTMAVVTTMAMPPMLRWALKRLPLRKKERLRLEREALDAKGFVTNLERLLLAADDSANGKLAARLVGAIAGSGGKPTTILDLSEGGRDKKAGKRDAERKNPRPSRTRILPTRNPLPKNRMAEVRNSTSKRPPRLRRRSKRIRTRRSPAASRSPPGSRNRAIPKRSPAKRARAMTFWSSASPRLAIPMADSARTSPASPTNSMVRSPSWIRIATPIVRRDRLGRILIPVNGTEVSRRAVEVGLALARATGAKVTALYVTRASANAGDGKAGPRRRPPGAMNRPSSRISAPWPSVMKSTYA